jgi:hypothetical protein
MRCTKLASALAFAGTLACAWDAAADVAVIGSPGDHPSYTLEAEPHGLIGFGRPFRGGRVGLGAGFRATFVLLDDGIIPGVNDSAGIGVGADLFVRGGTIFVPVTFQWNFWLTNHWSLFLEPGVGFAIHGGDVLDPILMLGGRYHFTDKVALTLRLGYPALSIGASFFL